MAKPQSKSRFVAIVPAAGVGSRMVSDRPKQYLSVSGQPLIQHTINRLLMLEEIERIYVGISARDEYWQELASNQNHKVSAFVGGAERHQTVLEGLKNMEKTAQPDDWVLVHDAARPCFDLESVKTLINVVQGNGVGGLLAHPVADTLKLVGVDQSVESTVDRSLLWAAQTPQIFRYSLLKDAIEQAVTANIHITDESSAVEALGYKPLLVEAPSTNVKVTRACDLVWVEKMLREEA